MIDPKNHSVKHFIKHRKILKDGFLMLFSRTQALTLYDSVDLPRSLLIVSSIFWDSKNIKKQVEFMGIILLLLDEKIL